MSLTESFWAGVPPLDAHYYLDHIEASDPVADSGKARDAEAEVLAAIIYPALERPFTRSKLDVRHNLLGQWTDDGHSPFSATEILELRKTALRLVEAVGVDRLKEMFSL